MATVGVDSQPKSSGLVLGWQPLGAVLHSSNEPGDLSQWLCHDDSTINIFLKLLLINIIILLQIIIIIIITTMLGNWVRGCSRSMKMAPLDRLYATFYWSAIVNIALSCTIFELCDVDLKLGVRGHSRSLKLVPFESLGAVSYYYYYYYYYYKRKI